VTAENYQAMTRELLHHIKAPNLELSSQLSLILETDLFMLHLEFTYDGATIGFILRDVPLSQLPEWYQKITAKVNAKKYNALNAGVSIMHENNITVNTYIPNEVLTAVQLMIFYDYVTNDILLEL